ncbi:hypothetical protein [Mucilaginibacter sp.]|uniref:hypothetical protein n=1 Tax=Mucilaginibacter sp. TaxID=1882438 RepID=UPI003D0E4A94
MQKKSFRCLTALLLCCALGAQAQQTQPKYYQISQQQLASSVSSDTKKNFWDFVAYAGSIMNNTANGFSINPTLDKLGFKGNSFKYVQFNFTPVTKGTDITKYDSLNVGFTVAILNNFSLAKWKKRIDDDPNVQRFLALRTALAGLAGARDYVLTQYPMADRGRQISDFEFDMAGKFAAAVDSGKIAAADLKYLAPEYKYVLLLKLRDAQGSLPAAITGEGTYDGYLDATKSHYNLPTTVPGTFSPAEVKLMDEMLIFEANQVYDIMQQLTANFIKKAPQLNAVANLIQNFAEKRMQGYYAELNYARYFGKGSHFSYTAKTNYSVENDTTLRNVNFQRQQWKTTLSLDWLSPFWNQNYAKTSPVELKFALEYDRITKGELYKDEKRSAWSPALSLTLNISDKVAIPLTLKYDDQKSNLFGFLSVQYNLGAK